MEKIAIITGAARGIGRGIAQVMCEKGYYVVMLGKSDQIYEESSILESQGYKVEAYKCNITERSQIDTVVCEIIKKHQKIDVLINNAGVSRIKAFEEIDEELLDFQMNTNIKGTWNMTQAVIPYMRERRCGNIVNMASVTGPYVCDKGYTAYGMTKAAIIGLTKTIASEYAEYGIRCNAVCPGFILTPAVMRSAKTTNPQNPDSVIEKIAEGVPLKKLGTPEQIGNLVAFLAGDESDYITGTSNIIDGGAMLPETHVMGIN